ncbi:phospholipase D family protein [Peribacillus frigoritolerans]|jgi:HKD family nuclease|uniref:phospholipase D family protein n=1 Tax=Peribacillus frigoritolerans TaxID=450367 RepID=UPI002281226D|nr:phospholipase D family protein [Peribacillus frigoritolerans]MCY9005189.1 phospholipase D family protein [Peribacillus frigoritolerans]MED4633191.1 phospholipase D family protein [Peribacillus frigoritolerans]
MKKWYKRKRFYLLVSILIIIAIVIAYNSYKPLPDGISYEGKVHHVEDIDFIYDLSYHDEQGNLQHEQRIFQTINQAIEEADSYIVIDMFLFNAFYDEKINFPKLTETLKDNLVEQKKKKPDLQIIFITDEVNTSYNAYQLEALETMKKNGIDVIVTNLDRLRDPNPLYSGVYRTFFQWFGESGKGWIVNPMAKSAPKVTLRSYLRLMNIKANHRKVVATEKTAIISSANPHDASGFHSNIAFQMDGNIIGDFVKAEEAASKFSGGPKSFPEFKEKSADKGPISVQLLTEGKINEHVLKAIKDAKNGDKIHLAMFYIADREVVEALTDAAKRGVKIEMILDPNQNAFGSEKIGLPNLPVAAEFEKLGDENISIRWYKTDKEQFHTKLMMIQKADETVILGGSANYTSRNLDDYNLEANVEIHAPNDADVSKDVDSYFHRLWTNQNGTYTVDYSEYQKKLPVFKYLTYRIQKVFRFTTY